MLGALVGGWVEIPKRVLAAMLAFAAGALITALSFELFEDSYEKGGIWRAAIGLAVGAIVFTALSAWLDRVAEGRREKDHGSEKLDVDAAAEGTAPSSSSVSGAAGLALLAAVTLDGVPENVALGVSLGRAPAVSLCWSRSSCPTSRSRSSAAPPCAPRAGPGGTSSGCGWRAPHC